MSCKECFSRYGYLPQRTALWIYWQAVVLLAKGVGFFPVPGHRLQGACGGCRWQPALLRRCWAIRVARSPGGSLELGRGLMSVLWKVLLLWFVLSSDLVCGNR